MLAYIAYMDPMGIVNGDYKPSYKSGGGGI
jgi:hypothetical protein